jgi:transposase
MLFLIGYEPLRRDRRKRLDTLQTGDGRRLPDHLKAQVRRELDRLELLLDQIKTVEDWSLTSLKEKLIKIGAKVVRHGRSSSRWPRSLSHGKCSRRFCG